jgi:hypothetical protein
MWINAAVSVVHVLPVSDFASGAMEWKEIDVNPIA